MENKDYYNDYQDFDVQLADAYFNDKQEEIEFLRWKDQIERKWMEEIYEFDNEQHSKLLQEELPF